MNKTNSLLLYTVLMIPVSTNAQVEPKLDSAIDLTPFVVSYEAGKYTPVSFLNISGARLKQLSTGQEPSFILANTPSVAAYSDAGNTQGYSYFRMRGIDQTRINMSFDGVPLNEPEDQGAYFANYPDLFNSVSRVQIQRGVGTSINGVASYGGSVQIFSPDLRDSAYANLGFGYGSFNSLRAYAEYNSGIKNRKALYARVSEIYSDGYKHHSKNHSQSAFISGAWFGDRSTWKFNLLAGQQRNQLAWLGVPDSLIRKDRRTNVVDNEKDRFFQSMAQVQHTIRAGKYSQLQSSVYYTHLNGNYDFNLNSFLGLPSTDEMFNYALNSHLTGLFSNYQYQKDGLGITAGLHANRYSRRHIGSEKSLGKLYENKGFKNEFSSFVKLTYAVSRFHLFSDIQYRYTDFDYKGFARLDKIRWNFLNPRIGVGYSLSNETEMYYSIGRTSREPTRNDLFLGNDDLALDSVWQPMTGSSRPESVIDQEMGVRMRRPGFSLDVNLYYMRFRNEIVLDGNFGPNGLALTSNVESSYRMGVELTVNLRLNKEFSLLNNSSFNYSRIREQKERFSPILTPPVIISQDLTWSRGKISALLNARYQHGSFIDFANSSRIVGYVLLNANAQYSTGKMSVGAFLNNITNTRYYNHGYVEPDGTAKYFVQAPANFYLSLKYSLL